MLARRRSVLSLVMGMAVLSLPPAPAAAFDDKEFCVLVQQLAIAVEKDIGVWIDRVTRAAGMAVSCDSKVVEFKRFTYTPSAAMDAAWRQRKTAEWNATHCSRPLWLEAVRGDWKIIMSLWAADGGHVSLQAQCR